MRQVIERVDGYPTTIVRAMAQSLGITQEEAVARIKAGGLVVEPEPGGFRDQGVAWGVVRAV